MTETRRVHDLWPLTLMRARAGTALPDVEVARQESHQEVADLIRSGRRVVPMGGGSGVCVALAPEPGDLVLDLRGLDGVEIDEANLLVRAGAGVNGLDLERRLNERGLTLGHFPSSLPVTTVGGLVSTRSSGQESSRHGGIEDLVAGLTVALEDGTIAEARVHPRTAAGPPLPLLFAGAEGAVQAVAVSKNNTLVAAGGADKAVRVYNLADAKLIVKLDAPGAVKGLAFSPNNLSLVATCEGGGIQTWGVLPVAG